MAPLPSLKLHDKLNTAAETNSTARSIDTPGWGGLYAGLILVRL
jgi:hypothetical protein